jgi:hypothetical protein
LDPELYNQEKLEHYPSMIHQTGMCNDTFESLLHLNEKTGILP